MSWRRVHATLKTVSGGAAGNTWPNTYIGNVPVRLDIRALIGIIGIQRCLVHDRVRVTNTSYWDRFDKTAANGLIQFTPDRGRGPA